MFVIGGTERIVLLLIALVAVAGLAMLFFVVRTAMRSGNRASRN